MTASVLNLLVVNAPQAQLQQEKQDVVVVMAMLVTDDRECAPLDAELKLLQTHKPHRTHPVRTAG